MLLRVLEHPACQQIQFKDVFKIYVHRNGSNGASHSVSDCAYVSAEHA